MPISRRRRRDDRALHPWRVHAVAERRDVRRRRPGDRRGIARVPEGGPAEVDAAVEAARAALTGPWGKLSVAARAELLHAIADGITRRFDDFVAAEVADTGKPRALAAHLDIPRGAANFKVFADLIKNVATEAFEMVTPTGRTGLNYARRRPKGVIAVICPWNLPLLLLTWKVAPALACGNTVVVKPSEETPATAALLGEVMTAAGVPRGVYNVVHGFGPAAARRAPRPAPRHRRDHVHRRDPHRRRDPRRVGRSHRAGVDGARRSVQDEIFGPCCAVLPFERGDEAEAVRLANDTPYGLAASVYTQDLARAHRVAAQLEVGVCWVNCWFVRDLRTAFGGSKRSGIGREGGVHSLEFYSELSNICVEL